MYTLTHTAYCGMTSTYNTLSDRTDSRDGAARKIRQARRRGLTVTTLERGRQWEILEPEGAAMVPDACGVLTLHHTTWECRECGCAHETRGDADECCTFWDEYADTDATDEETA